MNTQFTPQEGAALFALLADNSTDIILRTDCHGFIVRASPASALVGLQQADELFGRHMTDIVHPRHASAIRQRLAHAVAGQIDDSWGEFSTLDAEGAEHWFEIRMRGVAGDRGSIAGVLAVMRSIDERKGFERQLFVATVTDQLTGLTNRTAFTTMLGHLLADGVRGCLAIFDLDHFKAINLRHGQSVGDEVLVAFADFLRISVREKDIISRIGGESIGVLLPGVSPAQAESICRRIVASIAEISSSIGADRCGAGAIPVTASAGVAVIGVSVDDTMRRAELALALAKAKGRNRLEMDRAQGLVG